MCLALIFLGRSSFLSEGILPSQPHHFGVMLYRKVTVKVSAVRELCVH